MSTPERRRLLLALAVVGVVGVGLVVARRGHHARTGDWFGGSWLQHGWFESTDVDTPGGVAEIPDAAVVAWCAPDLTPVPGGGCFAAPVADGSAQGPWPLVLYLHGIFDPAADADELDRQARVAARARAAGFAVLALRGHVGECSAPEYASRVCWPSNERNEDAGPAFVSEWTVPLAHARRQGGSGRRYVLGFSNGAYFAGLLAERGWFDAGAFVVARGGPVAPVQPAGARFPMLLALSDGDPSYEEMIRLDQELTKQAWPHEKHLSHGGHALPDGDIDAALAFFTEQERLAR